jgi:hypothetical protein
MIIKELAGCAQQETARRILRPITENDEPVGLADLLKNGPESGGLRGEARPALYPAVRSGQGAARAYALLGPLRLGGAPGQFPARHNGPDPG